MFADIYAALGRGGSRKFLTLLSRPQPSPFSCKNSPNEFFSGGDFIAGRTKQPIDLIAAKGRKHLTKQEYEERKSGEVVAPNEAIKPPDFLTKKEKKKFEEIAKILLDIGVMTDLDCDALGMYVKALGRYEKAVKRLETIRLSYDKKLNISKEIQEAEAWGMFNYQHKIVVRIEKELKMLGNPFGLDPTSRCKLVLPKKKEDEKPKNKFLA